MKKIIPILFFLILLVGVILRIYHLGQIPPGVNRDEASIGYTAYSLLMTGKDEYGRFLPISFQSFGDWKLPVYIYETVLSVAAFGLNTFAVRLPSALAGIAFIILVYFLVLELLKDKILALTTMFLTAISPWSIHLSRVESESNTAVTFVTFGVLLLLKSFKKRKWLIIPSVLFLALSFCTYAGNYIFTPLLSLGLFLIYRKEIVKQRFGVLAIIIYVLLCSFIWFKITGASIVKISGIGIFSDPSIVNAEIEIPRNEHTSLGSSFSQVFHNRAVLGAQRLAQNYLNAFSPEFLFIRGGVNFAHNIFKFGNMYLVEAPFLFLGLLFLLSQKKTKTKYLILWWFFVAPLAPSITKDAPHTNRMFAIFPMVPLITACGLLSTIRFFNGSLKYIFLSILVVLFGFNICLYLDRYYVHFPYEESQYWGVLYEKMNILFSQERYSDKKIVMDGPENSPYIYFLFYSKYDPALYQQQVIRYPITPEGFVHVKAFGRYEFRNINLLKDPYTNNTIIVVKTDGIPSYFKKVLDKTDILLPSGDPIYSIIDGSVNGIILPENLPTP